MYPRKVAVWRNTWNMQTHGSVSLASSFHSPQWIPDLCQEEPLGPEHFRPRSFAGAPQPSQQLRWLWIRCVQQCQRYSCSTDTHRHLLIYLSCDSSTLLPVCVLSLWKWAVCVLTKSEGLLLCSQELATGPYPEPDESSPHPYNLFIYLFIYILLYMSKCHTWYLPLSIWDLIFLAATVL